jgi:hypothetical protein
MEVRIVSATVPETGDKIAGGTAGGTEDLAPADAPSSATAEIQLLRYLGGFSPEWPNELLRVRDIIQRNAAEDMLLARSLEGSSRARFPEMNLMSWWPLVYPHFGADRLGSEWYLKVRDFLYRFDP